MPRVENGVNLDLPPGFSSRPATVADAHTVPVYIQAEDRGLLSDPLTVLVKGARHALAGGWRRQRRRTRRFMW